MNRLSFALALIAGSGIGVSAATQIIEYPIISYANTSILDIAKVELSDTATFVTFSAYHAPNSWIQLNKDVKLKANGKSYAVRSAQDIILGEKNTIPESGQRSFTLCFEPLPLSTQKFDFSEGESDNDWKLADILLTNDYTCSTALPKGLPEEIPLEFTDAPLPSPILSVGETTVKVHFLGDRREFASDLSFIIDETFLGEKGADMKFDEDGIAIVKFTQYGPASIEIMDRKSYLPFARFHINPGENVDCYIDGTISGHKAMMRRGTSGIALEKFVMHNGILSNYDHLLSPKYNYKNYTTWLDDGKKKFYHLDSKSYMEALKKGYFESLDSIKNADMPQMEKDFQTVKLQDMIMRGVADHKRMMRVNYFRTTERWYEVFSYDSIPATFTDEDLKEVTTWFDISNPQLLLVGSDTGLALTDWNALGVSGDLSKSIVKLSDIQAKASNATLKQEEVDEMRSLSNPFFAQVADSLFAEMNRKLAMVDNSVKYEKTPDVAPEAVLDAIVAPHKGKVVVVDLWNTWCGPCRNAIKKNEPLKEGELNSDDIVWIYIADESSDHFQYLEMIPKIKGLHYKLNKEQIGKISERFKVDGIPYYILIDREGNATGRPDLHDHNKYIKVIQDFLEKINGR